MVAYGNLDESDVEFPGVSVLFNFTQSLFQVFMCLEVVTGIKRLD